MLYVYTCTCVIVCHLFILENIWLWLSPRHITWQKHFHLSVKSCPGVSVCVMCRCPEFKLRNAQRNRLCFLKSLGWLSHVSVLPCTCLNSSDSLNRVRLIHFSEPFTSPKTNPLHTMETRMALWCTVRRERLAIGNPRACFHLLCDTYLKTLVSFKD